jgi:hypothetical protein
MGTSEQKVPDSSKVSQIWKFTITEPDQLLRMPKGATILSVQVQEGTPGICIWAVVDPNVEEEIRRFLVISTGDDFVWDWTQHMYLGTVQLARGTLVWHIFEDTDHDGTA